LTLLVLLAILAGVAVFARRLRAGRTTAAR
jgi:hypothetical protein